MSEVCESGRHINDHFQLKEERAKEHDVDEACYSLDEQLMVEMEESRTVSMFPCHSAQLRSPRRSTELVADDWSMNASRTYSEMLTPRGVVELERSLPIHDYQSNSDDSLTHPMETLSFSEPILPDFEHLLSGRSAEEEEESDQDVIRACRQLIQAGYKSDEIYAELNKMGFSGQFYDIKTEEDSDLTLDGIDEALSWTPEEQSRVVQMMQMGAQCMEKSCTYRKCHLGQKLISDIEADLENGQLSTSLVTRHLLYAVISHSSTCDDSPCTVPWCSFFNEFRQLLEDEDERSAEEKCAALQRLYHQLKFIDFEEIDFKIKESSEFIQLDGDVEWPCVLYSWLQMQHANIPPVLPKNGIDFQTNGYFGRCGRIGLTALSTTIPPIQLDIIQYETFESSTALWNQLRGLRHVNVVRHLWTCVDHNNVTVCREHFYMDGDSLESMIMKVNPRRIDPTTAVGYVTGLVSGAIYLNERHIFYLRWTASGIRMNYNYTSAQLSDFSSAITSSMIEDDEEVVDLVANSLPPNILPPEMCSTDDLVGCVGSYTEVWGVGCIMYHLSNGVPIHHTLRHEMPENIRIQVKNFPPEGHVNTVKIREIAEILAHVFMKKENRINLHRLADRFQNYLTSRRNYLS